MPHDVFIGYSRRDSAAAGSVVEHLGGLGLSCFRDVDGIRGSAEWVRSITTAIKDCSVYLFLISHSSVAADSWVQDEMHFARQAGKRFVPVVLDREVRLADDLSFYLSRYQFVHLGDLLQDALEKVGEVVLAAVDQEKFPAAYQDSADVSRRSTYCLAALEHLGLFVGENTHGLATPIGNAYVLHSNQDAYLGHQMRNVPRTSEFVLDAEVHHLDGPGDEWFGFEFGDAHPGDRLQFLVRADGWLRVAKSLNTFYIFLSDLHAATVADGTIRAGLLGVIAGRGIRASFAGLHIDGIALRPLLVAALDHWERLEMPETRKLLSYIASFAAVMCADPLMSGSHLLKRPESADEY